MTKKRVVILGSTGSIGVNALKVLERFPDTFEVVGLSAFNNIELLRQQVHKFKPRDVAVAEESFDLLKNSVLPRNTRLLSVEQDVVSMVTRPEVDIVLIAMRSGAALLPFLEAVRKGKRVAPANKEALVMAGDLLMGEAKKYGAEIIPIDSEQSAIFQCLQNQSQGEVRRIHLTASGGPLRTVWLKDFKKVTVKDILRHPRWKMGKKITVDSATLMNKGFEVIEAQKLFGLKIEQIQVLVHPEAIIHSMVEFVDGSWLAQLGIPDMRLPIQYALTFPRRYPTDLEALNLVSLRSLNFAAPDLRKFPALDLCFEVAKLGGTLPAVLNAADEVVVEAFLQNKIPFTQIYPLVEAVVRCHQSCLNPNLKDILAADAWARDEARRRLAKGKSK